MDMVNCTDEPQKACTILFAFLFVFRLKIPKELGVVVNLEAKKKRTNQMKRKKCQTLVA